jgi:hypothetical protein
VDDILKALLEVVFEVAWKGPGYLILRVVCPKAETAPDGCLVLLVGTAFWTVVALGICGLVMLLPR